ncbi:MAG TPA: SagB/ThcOx family dehydrogenase [Methanoregulaceae archaeon]|nr:SagB/ThcOx family dehydrogenase [Methanoregulaceae archaeon]
MKKIYIPVILLLVVIICVAIFFAITQNPESSEKNRLNDHTLFSLPKPGSDSDTSIEEGLAGRRSVRGYALRSLTLTEVSRILWAAQGISGEGGLRTAPSAGAIYPLEIYLVAGKVGGLSPGVYHYIPEGHSLEMEIVGDMREDIFFCALNQSAIKDAPALIVITSFPSRTTGKYGERGMRYVYMEAGHASQNVYLQAFSLHLGTVSIGAFHDECIRNVLGLDPNEEPLYIMPIGALP